MDNEIIKLLTIIAIPTVTIVGSNIVLFMNLNKKVDNLNDRITNLEIETKVGFEKLNSKFDRLDERYTNLNQRTNKIEAELKEQRSEFKEMLNKVLDVFNNFNRKDKDVVNQLQIRS